MAIKLAAIDIDNTLLTSAPEHKLTTENIQSIQQALQLGIKIVLCSARPLAGVKRFLKQAGITSNDQYVIVDNGALVQTVTGKTLATHTLAQQTVSQLAQFCQQNHWHYNAIDSTSTMCTTDMRVGFYTVQLAAKYQAPLQVFNHIADFSQRTFAKFGITEVPEILDEIEPEIQQKFGSNYYVVRSRPFLLEILDQNANKGQALTDLAQELRLKKQETMAIGDEINDLPMFEAAGFGISMGNGGPAVKKAADHITDDNDHSGVGKALHKFILDL